MNTYYDILQSQYALGYHWVSLCFHEERISNEILNLDPQSKCLMVLAKKCKLKKFNGIILEW